ncbi:MAG: ribosome silencing factor [Candidatus Omnitrophica bacterium]|nr:ribosome silencing factor [Candidatus Omnitrophota bacterium]
MTCAQAAAEKKAVDPVVLEVKGVTNLCDYFVICSGESVQQMKAIYKEITKAAKDRGYKVHHADYNEESQWMLIDFFDVIVHVFSDKVREFYDLENLWRDAKKKRIPKKQKKT